MRKGEPKEEKQKQISALPVISLRLFVCYIIANCDAHFLLSFEADDDERVERTDR